jgi:hypothetical protein
MEKDKRDSEFFQHIIQSKISWRDSIMPFPPFYYDAMSIEAAFLVKTERMKTLLPSVRLHPLRIIPGYSIMVISALCYRDTDIGSYNEVLIGIPITLDEPSRLFTGIIHRFPEIPFVYILHLPVTTEIALRGGIDFLGTPKFPADITFEEESDFIKCRLTEKGTHILTLAVRKGHLKPTNRSYTRMINIQGGYLLRWDFIMSEHQKSISNKRSDVQLYLGHYPISQKLMEMEIRRSMISEYSPHFMAIVGPVMESFKI